MTSNICTAHAWGQPTNLIIEDADANGRRLPTRIVRERRCTICRTSETLPECLHYWRPDGAVLHDTHTVTYQRCAKCGVRTHHATRFLPVEPPTRLEQAEARGYTPDPGPVDNDLEEAS
jgi:hypothetical protein